MIKKDGSVSAARNYREIPLWKDISSNEWNDWKWQLRNRFRTSVSRGFEIMENLRAYTFVLCVPTYVVDAPGGGGKTHVMPIYLVSRNDRRVNLRNYEGVISVYTEPEPSEGGCPYEDELRKEFPYLENREGTSVLLRGEKISVGPPGLERHLRSKRYKKLKKIKE